MDDIPLIVQDRRFRDDLLAEANLADQACVNGTLAPYLDVRTQRIRLRLLNASNARIYHFGFTDDRTFDLVGTDGGLLGAAHPTSRIQLSPAERAEIVVTMRPSERIVLRSYPPELQTGSWSNRFAGGDDMLDILELRAAAALAPSPSLPGRLADTPHLDTTTVAATRRFELKLPKINGQSMDMNRIDTAVLKNSTEIWEIENRDSEPHNFHIHDVQFIVLSIAGAPPPPELSGRKDTIYTPPKTPVRLAVRFADYADPDTPYMYHCHLLRHEDRGLMGQFVVLEPGQQPGKPSGHHHG